MVACVCPSTPRKHEFLLYCSLSILILNIINLILLEIGQVREIFNEHLQKALSKEYDFIESENGLYLKSNFGFFMIMIFLFFINFLIINFPLFFLQSIGRFITTYSAILLILIAFIEAQINFCFLSRSQTKHKKEKHSRKTRRPQQYIDNDQTADLEYVIPKVC